MLRGWHSEAEESTRGCGSRETDERETGESRWDAGALSAVHVQRADSNHGGRVFFKKLEFR